MANCTVHLLLGEPPGAIIDRPSVAWFERMKRDPGNLSEEFNPRRRRKTTPSLFQAVSFLLAYSTNPAATNNVPAHPSLNSPWTIQREFFVDRPLLLRLLKGGGANVDETDEHGDTALHRAARGIDGDNVAELIAGGANLNATNHQGRTRCTPPLNTWGGGGLNLFKSYCALNQT